MARKYKINDAGSKPDSPDLIGCRIEEKEDGSGYELVAKRVVLATSSATTPPFSFTLNNYDDWDWTITVDSISPSVMSGTWTNTDPNDVSTSDETDNWTASGSGGGSGEDEARAASAK